MSAKKWRNHVRRKQKEKNLVPDFLENRSVGSEHYGAINVYFQQNWYMYEVIYHLVIEIDIILCILYSGMHVNKVHFAKERWMTRNSTKSIHWTSMIFIKGLPSLSTVSFRLHTSWYLFAFIIYICLTAVINVCIYCYENSNTTIKHIFILKSYEPKWCYMNYTIYEILFWHLKTTGSGLAAIWLTLSVSFAYMFI